MEIIENNPLPKLKLLFYYAFNEDFKKILYKI